MARPGVVRVQPTYLPILLNNHSNGQNWFNLSPFKRNHVGKVYEDPSLWYRENGCDRVAFYMDTKAFRHKMEILRGYDIGGFSFWQLTSGNDPGINLFLEKLVKNQLPEKPYSLEELNARLKPVVPTAFKQLGKPKPIENQKNEPALLEEQNNKVEPIESKKEVQTTPELNAFPDEVEVKETEESVGIENNVSDEELETQSKLNKVIDDL